MSAFSKALNELEFRDIDQLVADQIVEDSTIEFKSYIDERRRLDYPWGHNQRRNRPIVRCGRRTDEYENYGLFEQLYRNGDANFVYFRKYESGENNQVFRFYVGWIFNTLAVALLSADKLRRAAGAAEMEYALDIQLTVRGKILLGFRKMTHGTICYFNFPRGFTNCQGTLSGHVINFPEPVRL